MERWADKEIRILEIGENQEIECYANRKQELDAPRALVPARLPDRTGEPEIDDDDSAEERQVDRIPPTVEQKGGEYEKSEHGACAGKPAQRNVGGDRRREKHEEINRVVEEHVSFPQLMRTPRRNTADAAPYAEPR